jgi:oligopeptide transport system substrate-binding protein
MLNHWLLLLILVLSGSVAAAGEVAIHRGNSAEPDTLDPQLALTWQDWNIVSDLFVGLTTLDAAGNTVPGVAESWLKSDDGLTYRFKLRRGLRWSDGEPLRAKDFVFSLRRLLTPATAASRITEFYAIQNGEAINTGQLAPETLGVAALDELTLEIQLSWPIPHLPDLLAWAPAAPVPAHVIEAHGSRWTQAGVAVSNGPYQLADWSPYEYVKLVRNPYFFDNDNVEIDSVYYYPSDDGATALRRFRAGEFDISYGIAPSQLRLARQLFPESMIMFPRPVTMYWVFNLQRRPFDDVRVREALSMAIDRDALVKALNSGEQPAYDLVAHGIKGYGEPLRPSWAALPMQERRELAIKLLAEAGFTADNPLEFAARYDGGGSNKRLGVASAAMWRAIGVNAELLSTDSKVHFADMKAGNFDLAKMGLSGRNYSAETFLQVFEHTAPRMNPGRYRNAELNSLMAQARRESDQRVRDQLLKQASGLVLQDHPYVAMHYYVSRNLVQPYIKGYEANPYDVHPTRFLTVRR